MAYADTRNHPYDCQLVRHRRWRNVHLYSAKLAGVVCYAFVATLFFDGYSRTLFAAALGLPFLTAAETLLALRTRVDEHAGSIFLASRR